MGHGQRDQAIPRDERQYMLGASSEEHARLIRQGNMLNPMTEMLLRASGIGPGMRVLDLGSGVGDVALLVARLVGPTGRVVGVEQDPAMIAFARQRIAREGLAGVVTFVQGDASVWEPEADSFDALVGRLILMYLPDPEGAVGRLVRGVRPGGIVAFHELDFTHWDAFPPVELHTLAYDLWRRLATRVGARMQQGSSLPGLFARNGITAESIRADATFADAEHPDIPAHMVDTVRSLLPLLLRFGLATEEEVGIDTYEQRVRAEMREKNAIIALGVA